MPRVLIVDDSPTARLALRQALVAEDIEVVGEAGDEDSALAAVHELLPDLVTMDVRMRREDGVDVTARIMAERARPIVIVTASDPRDPSLVYRAMQAGALEVRGKLPGPNDPGYAAARSELGRTVKVLARVPVVHRGRRAPTSSEPRASGERAERSAPRVPPPLEAPLRGPRPVALEAPGRSPRALLIGASTGGPPLVSSVLAALAAPFPVPIVLVQHIASGFAAGFAQWLGAATGHPAAVVTGPTELRNGWIHVAPDDAHLRLEPNGLLVRRAATTGGAVPSIDVLFTSAAEAFGRRQVAVLLTGMGRDGTAGMQALHRSGATTLVQHPDTCVVSSMPRSAIEAGAATRVVRPEDLPAALRAGFEPR